MDGLTRFASQIATGHVPDDPFVLFGQMTTADPSRSPAGTESAWAYTHLPQRVIGDAGPDRITGRWDTHEQDAMADRVEAQVERFAPGFRTLIGARRILAPTTLQAMNENLHNGSINNGTTALHQQAILRSTPGTGRPETPIENLYLASAAAHPRGGVHGAPGANAARAALRPRRLHTLLHRAQRVGRQARPELATSPVRRRPGTVQHRRRTWQQACPPAARPSASRIRPGRAARARRAHRRPARPSVRPLGPVRVSLRLRRIRVRRRPVPAIDWASHDPRNRAP